MMKIVPDKRDVAIIFLILMSVLEFIMIENLSNDVKENSKQIGYMKNTVSATHDTVDSLKKKDLDIQFDYEMRKRHGQAY